MFKVGDKVRLNNKLSQWCINLGVKEGDIGVVVKVLDEYSIGVKFKNRLDPVFQTYRQLDIVYNPKTLLTNANLSRLSTALGRHRSYLNKLIQVGCSDKTYNKIKNKLTIDWNSDKPLHVNDGVHVPFAIKPVNCVQQKHKDWLQSLMMKGCVKL